MLRISKGFTIIEFVIATALSTMLIGAIITTYIVGLRVFNQELSRSDIFWDGQSAMATMTNELRECLTVTNAQSDSVTFWWQDLDQSTSQEADEIVSYFLSGQSLIRTIGSSRRDLAQNVSSLNFVYDTTPAPKFITITLLLQRKTETATVKSSVRLRNE